MKMAFQRCNQGVQGVRSADELRVYAFLQCALRKKFWICVSEAIVKKSHRGSYHVFLHHGILDVLAGENKERVRIQWFARGLKCKTYVLIPYANAAQTPPEETALAVHPLVNLL